MSSEHFVISDSLPPRIEDVSFGYVTSPASTIETYGSFDVSGETPELVEATTFRDQQKELFLSDQITNPILNRCPKFRTEQTKRRTMFLYLQSLMFVQTQRYQDGQVQTLEDKMINGSLASKINELGFIETAAVIADGHIDDEFRQSFIKSLKEASRDIYGLPDRDRSLSYIKARIDKALALTTSDVIGTKEIKDYIDQSWNMPTDFTYTEPLLLSKEQINFYKETLKDECKEAVEHAFGKVGKKDLYSPSEMKDIFDFYIEARGFKEAGWSSSIVQGRTMCASNQETKTVEIGDKRPEEERTYEKVLQSMLHEIEIHVGRNVRGSKLGSGLAGVGLPGYISFEEPFAATTQEVYVGESTVRGLPYVIAVAVAVGYDGKERDFRNTFELTWRLSLAESYDPTKDLPSQISDVRKKEYDLLVRIWRGMPTDIEGCVFAKDISYENYEVIKFLQADGRCLPRDDFLRLLQAKYNPLQIDQDTYIRQQENLELPETVV
jgi:hypothetical protein